MSFYLQHGYGKGQKIQNLDAAGGLTGIILSPSDESGASLKLTVDACNDMAIRVLLDPQTYIYSATPPGSPKRHIDFGLDFGSLHWSQDAASVGEIVAAVEKAHNELGIFDTLMAPTVIQPGFNDVWTPLALQYARTSAKQWGSERTLVTLALEQQSLASWPQIDDWLDIATTLDVRGFYILINRPQPGYPAPAWSPEMLANLLRLIYTLTEVNDYEVIWGYSDIEGLLGLAAGASGIGSGWNYGSRKFSLSKWYPSTGGAAPTPRLGIGPLMTPVKAVGEADALFNSPLRGKLFSEEQIERFTEISFDNWSRLAAQEDHLAGLAKRSRLLSETQTVEGRLNILELELQNARNLFGEISDSKRIVDPGYARRVGAFAEALSLFRAAENL